MLQVLTSAGDGRADFLIVDNNTGEVTAWLNGGPDPMPQWLKIGVIATGASKSPNDIVVMGDFTGNGKADYMLVGKNGKVTGLANFIQERGFVPNWALKVTVAEGPSGATQQYVRLVDMNGDGKVDYVLLDKNGASQLFLNAGHGGKWQIGDGVFLTDREFHALNSTIDQSTDFHSGRRWDKRLCLVRRVAERVGLSERRAFRQQLEQPRPGEAFADAVRLAIRPNGADHEHQAFRYHPDRQRAGRLPMVAEPWLGRWHFRLQLGAPRCSRHRA